MKRRARRPEPPPRPCEKCGGVVDPNQGPITLVPWKCAACTDVRQPNGGPSRMIFDRDMMGQQILREVRP